MVDERLWTVPRQACSLPVCHFNLFQNLDTRSVYISNVNWDTTWPDWQIATTTTGVPHWQKVSDGLWLVKTAASLTYIQLPVITWLQPETSQAPGLGRSIQLDTSIVKWQGNGWERRKKERISLAPAVRNRSIENENYLKYWTTSMLAWTKPERVPQWPFFPLVPEISRTELFLRYIP